MLDKCMALPVAKFGPDCRVKQVTAGKTVLV